jgi:hypothetical protein
MCECVPSLPVPPELAGIYCSHHLSSLSVEDSDGGGNDNNNDDNDGVGGKVKSL